MFHQTDDDVFAVYNRLKGKYPLVMTTTFALNEGFERDCPILVGKAHGQIIELYNDYGMFVLAIMDEAQAKGIHGHPIDVEAAVNDIAAFMEGKMDYELMPFPNA